MLYAAAPRGKRPGTLRRLAVRFGAALVLSAVFSAVGTFLAFVTAKVGR